MASSESEDWRENTKSMTEKIKYIFDACFMTDLVIRIVGENDHEFKAHSLFLSMASSVFEVMIKSNFTEGFSKTIEIGDVSVEVFRLLLKYIYGHSIKLKNIPQAWDLYTVADKYLMKDLKELCLDYIVKNIDPSSACICLEKADCYNLDKLRDTALKIVRSRTRDVVRDDSFSKTHPETVNLILEQDKLSLSEIELFKAVEQWINGAIEKGGEEIRETLCSLLIPKFHFFNMSIKEFTEGPVMSNLMKKEDIISIYANLSSPDVSYPLPDGYVKSKRIRLGELEMESLYKTVRTICRDGYGRWIVFTVNKDITLSAVSLLTQEGPEGERYKEEIEVKFRSEGNDFWESVTEYIGEAEFSHSIFLQFPQQFPISKGRRYEMRIFTKGGAYKTIDFDGTKVRNEEVVFSFCKHPDYGTMHTLPLSSIHFNP